MSEKQKRTWRVPVELAYEGYTLVEAEDKTEASILAENGDEDPVCDLDFLLNVVVIGEAEEVGV